MPPWTVSLLKYSLSHTTNIFTNRANAYPWNFGWNDTYICDTFVPTINQAANNKQS